MPSGGIGVYINKSISAGITTSSQNECIVWLTLKAKFFKLATDRIIGCVYFSPIDSTYIHNTTARTDYFNILNEELSNKIDYDIFLCGDFNARTGQNDDNIETYLGNENESNTLDSHISSLSERNISLRNSKDHGINEYGRNLISLCKTSGLRIMNGRIGNTDDFTCFKSNGGASVVDYLLCKPSSMAYVTEFQIGHKKPESDHAPLSFTLSFPLFLSPQNEQRGQEITNYKWNKEKIDQYRSKFSDATCKNLEEKLITDCTDKSVSSNELCKTFNDLLMHPVSSTFKRKQQKHDRHPQKPWFNQECKLMKKNMNFYARRNDISLSPHAEIYRQLECEYLKTIQRCKRHYNESLRFKLENFHAKRPADYWKLWKSLKPPTVNNSTLT
jgi:exonuclease III